MRGKQILDGTVNRIALLMEANTAAEFTNY